MTHKASCDVVIAGAGPAAIIAACGLSRAGMQVAILGNADRPAPQGEHCHLFREQLWQRLFALVPALTQHLPGSEAARPLPVSRRELDSALRRAGADFGFTLCEPPFRRAYRRQGNWTIEVADGSSRQAAWLIDASGLSRTTTRDIGTVLGRPLPLDEADAAGAYRSWRLNNVAATLEPAAQRIWSPRAKSALLLVPEAEGTVLLTHVTLSTHGSLPPSAAAAIDAIADTRLAQAFEQATVVGEPSDWTGQPTTRIDLTPAINQDLNWYAIGDALLMTPPLLGWGFEQITEQVEILTDAASGGDLRCAGLQLNLAAERRFHQAIFALAQRGGLVPYTLTNDISEALYAEPSP